MSDDKTTIQELRQLAQSFVEEREWARYHTPKNLAMSIAIEAAELMEIFQWSGPDSSDDQSETSFLQGVQEELADVVVYGPNLSAKLGIDLSQAIQEKIDANSAKYPVEKVRGHYRKYTELETEESGDV